LTSQRLTPTHFFCQLSRAYPSTNEQNQQRYAIKKVHILILPDVTEQRRKDLHHGLKAHGPTPLEPKRRLQIARTLRSFSLRQRPAGERLVGAVRFPSTSIA
jgi:hypothetical protein